MCASTYGDKRRTSESWDEDTSGNLNTERHDSERAFNEQRHKDRLNDWYSLCRRVEHAKAGMRIRAACATFCEEIVHELSPAHTGVWVKETENRGYECNLVILFEA